MFISFTLMSNRWESFNRCLVPSVMHDVFFVFFVFCFYSDYTFCYICITGLIVNHFQ